MEPQKTYRCSNCGKTVPRTVDPGARSRLPRHFPFCSERCRLSDLNRWMEGDYTIGSDLPPDLDLEDLD